MRHACAEGIPFRFRLRQVFDGKRTTNSNSTAANEATKPNREIRPSLVSRVEGSLSFLAPSRAPALSRRNSLGLRLEHALRDGVEHRSFFTITISGIKFGLYLHCHSTDTESIGSGSYFLVYLTDFLPVRKMLRTGTRGLLLLGLFSAWSVDLFDAAWTSPHYTCCYLQPRRRRAVLLPKIEVFVSGPPSLCLADSEGRRPCARPVRPPNTLLDHGCACADC